jgi:hypothetical protein
MTTHVTLENGEKSLTTIALIVGHSPLSGSQHLRRQLVALDVAEIAQARTGVSLSSVRAAQDSRQRTSQEMPDNS